MTVQFAEQLLQQFVLGPGDAENQVLFFYSSFLLEIQLPSSALGRAPHKGSLQSTALRAPASVSAGCAIKGLCCHSLLHGFFYSLFLNSSLALAPN